MVAIPGDDVVFPREATLHTSTYGLLAVVEVTKPADEFGLVELVGHELDSSH